MSDVDDLLLALHGGDLFDAVRMRSKRHQRSHRCGLHDAGPSVMHMVAHIAKCAGAQRVLDLGCGIGYSTLWLADAVGPSGHVFGIDDDETHVEIARRCASDAGLADRITFVAAHTTDIVPQLDGPFDLIHDDAWFARRPDHLDAAVDLLPPGGTMTMANWFLLIDALADAPRNDWEQFAGPGWADDTLRYARHLSERPDLDVAWTRDPPIAVAVKQPKGR